AEPERPRCIDHIRTRAEVSDRGGYQRTTGIDLTEVDDGDENGRAPTKQVREPNAAGVLTARNPDAVVPHPAIVRPRRTATYVTGRCAARHPVCGRRSSQ